MTIDDSQLRSIIDRIQRRTEDRKSAAEDIAEIYSEAKAFGYDKSAIKWVISELEKPYADRQERDAIRDLYMTAALRAPARAIA